MVIVYLYNINSEACKSKVPWSMEADNIVVVGFVRNSCDLVFHFCCIDPTLFVLPLTIFVFSPYHSFARMLVGLPLATPRMDPPSPDYFCFHWLSVAALAMPTSRLHHHLDQIH